MRLSLPRGKEIAYTYDLPHFGGNARVSNKLTMPQAVQWVIAAVDEVATAASARTLTAITAPLPTPRGWVDVLGGAYGQKHGRYERLRCMEKQTEWHRSRRTRTHGHAHRQRRTPMGTEERWLRRYTAASWCRFRA
jgi:hypothetical protein